MKDCKKIHPLLSDYLDKLLSSHERNRVEAHLKDCPDARKELEELRRLREVMVALPEPKPPHDLHQRIMAKVQGHPMPVSPRRPFWVMPAGALAAAAMVTVILLVQNPGMMNFEITKRLQAPVAQQAATPGQQSPFLPKTAKPQTNAYFQNYAPAEPQNKDGTFLEADKTKRPLGVQYELSLRTAKKMRSSQRAADIDLAMDKAVPKEANIPAANLGPSSQTVALGASFGGSATQKSEMGITTNGAIASSSVPNITAVAAAPPASAPANPAPTPITFWGGSLNPSTTESQELVTDAATFEKYWQEFQPGQTPPAVDFTTQAVVVLMDQERLTAGYSIHVATLEEKPDQLVIHYKVEAPAPGAVTAQVLTRPWALQIISKPTKLVVFQKD